MSVKFTWTNRNISWDGTYVYRSTSPIDPSALPAPIATLDPGITEFTDTTNSRGVLYYYRFGVFKGTDVAISKQYTVYEISNSGPGPQTFFEGDWDRGYFGVVQATDMFTATALASTVGITEGTMVNDSTAWLKFAYKGKVLFVPQLPIRTGVSWNTIYNAGCVYGTDDNGKYPTATPTNQKKVVTTGDGSNFLVRLMRGFGSDPTTAFTSNTDLTVNNGSEWDMLMPNVASGVNASQIDPNWAALGLGSTICWNMESYSTTTSAASRASGSGVGYQFFSAKSTVNSSYGWRPVLELIPTF